jgi:hypothetical protein
VSRGSEITAIRKNSWHGRILKILGIVVPFICLLYLILLIPVSSPPITNNDYLRPFAWKQDSLWSALETQFIKARAENCFQLTDSIDISLRSAHHLLDILDSRSWSPDLSAFADLENRTFWLAPLIGACPSRLMDYINFFSRLRNSIKNQSMHWDMNDRIARETIYRLLYGGRAAVEEVMLQADTENIPACIYGLAEPSQTPAAEILGVNIHSGDILVSRGGAPVSALIARGNDYQGNFSHVALVYIDETTHRVSIVEAHIERGVAVATIDEYLKDTKLRVLILRLRADLPQLTANPLLPHQAAKSAYTTAIDHHIPYDFEMNYQDHAKLFCSEVVSAPYQQLGINLWMGISSISSPGVVRWLSSFGVRYFETQEPSDLEYDPQLRVVAEWRDMETLFKDHIDNAVIDVMLEGADRGAELEYDWYMLPVARTVRLYSMLLNIFDGVGPVPEGMSAAAALRNQRLSGDHKMIAARVYEKSMKFREEHGYTAPYWQLLELCRKSVKEINR